MAFGTPSGPPASRRQLGELLALLEKQGYTGFRDARGPLGLTQRQGGGKFTRDEAEALIDSLLAQEAAAEMGIDTVPPATEVKKTVAKLRGEAVTARDRAEALQRKALRDIPTEMLAAELQQRGWAVMEP